ncbi:MAG TPA: hypothetical protein VK856_00575 [Anaerolineaceae bacterium]|nr:hypothetical protein [Anaerolineaceae bacterium]
MRLEESLSSQNQKIWQSLKTPALIQAFLDSIPYSPEDENRSPRRVLEDRQAHCLDGGLFAAAALSRLGFPPIIIDLLPSPGRDDDHVLAIFKLNNRFGALAKSNYVGLRFREPVYRSVRELVMSYFEAFFNSLGEKTLRSYTVPYDLRKLDHLNWETDDSTSDLIEQQLKHLRSTLIITSEMEKSLSLVDKRSYEGHTLGIDPSGVYQIKS